MVSVAIVAGCAISFGTAGSAVAKTAPLGHSFSGYSHHYADRFHGKRTASGQAHNKFKFTAAHRSLPFGTHLHVTNTRNGKSCVVVVNDRGPFGSPSLVLDVSKAAAHKLGFPGGGKIPIACKVIDPKEGAIAIKDHEVNSVFKDTSTGAVTVVAVKPEKTATTALTKQVALACAEMAAKISSPKSSVATKIAAVPAKPIAVKPATPKATAQPEAPDSNTTFLLVINDALEADCQVQSAIASPNAKAHAAYAPTVFMKVENAIEAKPAAKPAAPAIADGNILM